MLIITISFKRWPLGVNQGEWAERIKDALTHVLRLVGLIDADIEFKVE